MNGIGILENKVAEEIAEPWKNFPNHLPAVKPEMSKVYGWFDLPKDGGGDIDLADYDLGIN